MRNPLPAAAARCACVLSLAIGAATCRGVPGSQTGGDRQPWLLAQLKCDSGVSQVVAKTPFPPNQNHHSRSPVRLCGGTHKSGRLFSQQLGIGLFRRIHGEPEIEVDESGEEELG